MESQSLTKELEELREMVNQSSEHTQRQLQNIDSGLLVGSLISLILALGISFQLKILIYWIPASFILFFIGILYWLLPRKDAFKKEAFEEVITAYQTFDKKFYLVIDLAFKSMSPITTAIGLVYIVTLIALGLIVNNTITVSQPFNILIPFISALLGISLPLIFERLIEKYVNKVFSELVKRKETVKPKEWDIIVGVVNVVIILILVGLPIWAFSTTRPIISDYIFLIIVLFLQFMFMAVSASYFSSLSVKKELNNTLTNFANLDYLINDFILSKNINEEKVKKLKELYLTAKQYDVLVDSLKFVNLYYISMNNVYFNRK
ncbi:MAG: hypothetical protein WCE94_14365 [Candidatus Methanoperedens sp.]